jgi:hypothetical protein
MAHFAELNPKTNMVKRVIVVNNTVITDESGQEVEQIGIDFCKQLFGENTEWVQTSYNANFRKCFAGPGFRYDAERDIFVPPNQD